MIDTILKFDSTSIIAPRGTREKYSADTTSDFQSLSFPKSETVPSFFQTTEHLGKFEPKPVPQVDNDWILGVFILCFSLLAWLNYFYHKRFRQMIFAPFSKRYMNQLLREGDFFSERITFVLSLTYLLTLPLLAYQYYEIKMKGLISLPVEGIRLYLIFLLVFIIFWVLKIFVIRILGGIFKTPQTTTAYLHNIFVMGFLSSLVILPIMVPVVYIGSEIFLYIAVSLFFVLFVLRFIKGFIIGISLTRFPYFYLFVYLCTLEILPWVVLTKLLTEQYF